MFDDFIHNFTTRKHLSKDDHTWSTESHEMNPQRVCSTVLKCIKEFYSVHNYSLTVWVVFACVYTCFTQFVKLPPDLTNWTLVANTPTATTNGWRFSYKRQYLCFSSCLFHFHKTPHSRCAHQPAPQKWYRFNHICKSWTKPKKKSYFSYRRQIKNDQN